MCKSDTYWEMIDIYINKMLYNDTLNSSLMWQEYWHQKGYHVWSYLTLPTNIGFK